MRREDQIEDSEIPHVPDEHPVRPDPERLTSRPDRLRRWLYAGALVTGILLLIFFGAGEPRPRVSTSASGACYRRSPRWRWSSSPAR